MGENSFLAFAGGTIIDGTGKDPVEDAVLVVHGAVIEAVGSRGEVEVPAGCEVVDVSGKTVMPGMFDCHCHVSLITMSIEKRLFTPKTVEIFQTAQMMRRTLHAGFTTIREPGILNDIGLREAVEMGLVEGPRLVLAGGIGQTGGHFDEYYPRGVEVPLLEAEICDGVAEVQKAARRVLRRGFDFIKVCVTGGVASPADSPEYTEWTLEELKAIVHEASARGKAVMAHAEGTEGIKNAIRAGVRTVEHGSMLDDEAVEMFLETGTYLVPTIVVFETLVERGEEMGLTPVSLAKAKRLRDTHLKSFSRAAAAGIRIALGTDAIHEEMHGRNARELELMVRHGFTPMQALVAATKTSAQACRLDDRLGTLEAGKLASLLVVAGDPLKDISILQEPSRLLAVMKEGAFSVDRLGRQAPTA
ncbi:MAG: amidohydrolase family protein [Deltaproteobacteria bacterium]|nr:amidohydrolase family protein [Deltaproteobacteria bacterium]